MKFHKYTARFYNNRGLKMLKFIVVSLVMALVMFSRPVQAEDVNEALQNICKIVENDDKGLLRKKVGRVKREFTLRFNDYYDGIRCGGSTLLEYADTHQSMDSMKFMVSKLKVSTIKDTDYASTLSPAAQAIISARVN